MKLFFEALAKVTLGIVLVGVLVFLPAGGCAYPGGVRLMIALFGPMVIAGVVMVFKSPDLLRKRLKAKEEKKDQDLVVKLSGLMFILGFVAAGLSYRFNFLMLPDWASWAGVILLLSSYIIYIEVIRENKYLSRVVEIQDGQQVVSTGLYGIVRHPMYGATLFLFIAMPIILGSTVAVIVFLAYPAIIAKRIAGEEALLEKELPGYIEYKQKVRYKMLPFIW